MAAGGGTCSRAGALEEGTGFPPTRQGAAGGCRWCARSRRMVSHRRVSAIALLDCAGRAVGDALSTLLRSCGPMLAVMADVHGGQVVQQLLVDDDAGGG